MNTQRICPECQTAIPSDALDGLCPRCLLGLGSGGDTVPLPDRNRASEPAPPPAGILGNYEVLEVLGAGGMGIVYKARQTDLARIVALKMMKSGVLASGEEIKRFRAEARAAARLQHPNVVRVHDIGEIGGQLFFTMDYVEGKTLAQQVGRTPLPVDRAARYLRTIARATHFAHEQGILHRDLKPQNVIIDTNDEPRITDFGLAKQIDLESDPTLSGRVLGTPSYMPPEQAAGRHRQMDRRSDVYSLGAILYDLLTARPPFRADNPVDTLRQVIDAEPAAPRLLNPKVPRDLETICLKCLRKDPDQRYASAQALAEDLDRFLQRKPIVARPLSFVGRTWRWYRRNPVIGTLAGLVMVMGLLQGVSAFVLRNELREKNTNLANVVSLMVDEGLDRLSLSLTGTAANATIRAAMTDIASDDGFRAAMAGMNTNWFSTNRVYEALAGRPFPGATNEAQNWVAMTLNGELLARYPPTNTIVINRMWRDYATNALHQNPGEVYFSRIYHSHEDQHWKFGITTVVREGATPVGLLTLMINTGSAKERLGLPEMDQEVEVLGLVDRAIPAASLPPDDEYVAFLRTGLTNGAPLGPYRLKEFERRADYYFDKYASATNSGHVMVGVASKPIPGTHYYVVVKSDALHWPWFSFKAFSVLVVFAGLALLLRVLWRRAHPEEMAK